MVLIDDGKQYKEMSLMGFGDTRSGPQLAQMINDLKNPSLRRNVSNRVHDYFHRLKGITSSNMDLSMKMWAIEHAYDDFKKRVDNFKALSLREQPIDVTERIKKLMKCVGIETYRKTRKEVQDYYWYID